MTFLQLDEQGFAEAKKKEAALCPGAAPSEISAETVVLFSS
jgi:hypothetical protein